MVNVKPMDQDGKDLEWYALGSVLLLKLTGIFHNSIRRIKKTECQVQVYRPFGNTVSLDKKFLKWQGDDNH